ncbi:alpha/beta fold hydrolase [Bordetella sp. BOR01]|uniref:alpha/beta fold hydrolase n=1 Tax=Bordetella sp. BOR01 TaxID=2854779 RepID=UPI001C497517|nr:alpha/beta hydrolase [Bordetella sp. BOR01]MBV7484909.1 alpha/beta hydrolase [Bordetella sp. BOR01]
MSSRPDITPQYGQAQAGDGATLHYQIYRNKASDQCIVLLHSLAMDYRFWRLIAPALASWATVICPDVRGHGQSSKPTGPYSISLFARDLKELLQSLGYRQAIVGGASMGGCIALQFGIDYPELATSLALIDTTAWYGPTAPADWSGRGQKAVTEGFGALVQFQTTRWFSDEFRRAQPDIVQTCVDTFLANDSDAYVATCHAMGSFDGREGAKRIGCPAEVVVGEQDYAAPVSMAQDLHAVISGSALTVIPSARHLTPLETPTVIVQAFERLLAGAGDTPV